MTKQKEVSHKPESTAELGVDNAIKHLQEIYQACMSLQYSIDGLGEKGHSLGAQLSTINFHRTEAEHILKKLIES